MREPILAFVVVLVLFGVLDSLFDWFDNRQKDVRAFGPDAKLIKQFRAENYKIAIRRAMESFKQEAR